MPSKNNSDNRFPRLTFRCGWALALQIRKAALKLDITVGELLRRTAQKFSEEW